MKDKIFFRPNTYDEGIFRAPADANEYKLPDVVNPNDIFIDMGCHIGGFVYACLRSGALHIYAYESYHENYNVAAINLEEEIKSGVVKLYNLAVWRSDIGPTILHNSGLILGPNTGVCNVLHEYPNYPVNTISLDQIIDTAINDANKNITNTTDKKINRIKFIKTDCEGSEYAIFLTSKKLSLVDYICGEYHVVNVSNFASINGKTNFNGYDLVNHLNTQGFESKLFEFAPNPVMGTFYSKRKELPEYFKGINIHKINI